MPQNLTGTVYDRIYDQITTGRIAEGAVLSEAALAARLGVSRTPVSVALRQLAAEGLVERVPRFGTVVRSFDPGELRELYEMREALESFAAMTAASRIEGAGLARLQSYCEEMERIGAQIGASGGGELNGRDLRRFLAADLAFHLLIVQATGNRSMAKIVARTRATSRLLRLRRAPHDATVVEEACEDHRRILGALQSGDGERARRLTAEHIRHSRDRALQGLEGGTSLRGSELRLAGLPATLQRELGSLKVDREGVAPRRRRRATSRRRMER